MDTRILQSEVEIVGGWYVEGAEVKADQAAKRIDDLIDSYLVEIARSDDGWSVLYQDPKDGRYWELTFPESGSHGGGAPRLIVASTEETKQRYHVN